MRLLNNRRSAYQKTLRHISTSNGPLLLENEGSYTPTSCASLMKPVANTPVGLVQKEDTVSKNYAPWPFPGASLTSINSCRGLRSYCEFL